MLDGLYRAITFQNRFTAQTGAVGIDIYGAERSYAAFTALSVTAAGRLYGNAGFYKSGIQCFARFSAECFLSFTLS